MKIGIATGMFELDEKLRKLMEMNKDMTVTIVNYREFFDKKDFDVTVISDRLLGDMNIEQLFFLLKSKNTRIVYLTNEDDVQGVKKCFGYSINDILFDPVKPEDIIKLILDPNSFADISDIYLKYSNMQLEAGETGTPIKIIKEGGGKPKVVEKVVEKVIEKPVTVEKTVYKTKILKKKILTFYSCDNALLTADLITQLSVLLSKRVQQKVLVLDFNTLFPVMDNFLGVTKEVNIESKYDVEKSTSLTLMYNAIERNNLNESNFTKFVKKTKYKNLDLATGNYNLMLFEKTPNDYFSKIVNTASKIYDTIFINTNPDISLGSTFIPIKMATDNLFIIQPNYTNIRNTLFIADNFKNVIAKNKLNFVVYDVSPKSLDSEIIEELFRDYKLIGYIPQDDRKEEALNKQKPFIDSIALKKSDIKAYMSLLEKLDYIPKVTLLDKLRGGVR
ncbi:MinD/ParA family ATP-binding protein [Clostridium felsineum]|uniref:Uncharacterized protein n=1 Tax=Clostridium felsineum TaxID=36839 RepID=A0A1S8LDP9_9CLOT|nr:hypothetical protein [Clostridium felsineum]URZ05892.1 hypothetical protein CLROS_012240 [Clostridium felsineum]URZ10929.1 hypothetical protein CROST_016450 [Clostridium felsineum]